MSRSGEWTVFLYKNTIFNKNSEDSTGKGLNPLTPFWVHQCPQSLSALFYPGFSSTPRPQLKPARSLGL